MWKCPVCETEYGALTACPRCGFDGSCDYEHYPTPFAVAGAKSTRALRREWEQKQGPGLDQLLMEWFIGSHQKKDATAAERCFRERRRQAMRRPNGGWAPAISTASVRRRTIARPCIGIA